MLTTQIAKTSDVWTGLYRLICKRESAGQISYGAGEGNRTPDLLITRNLALSAALKDIFAGR